MVLARRACIVNEIAKFTFPRFLIFISPALMSLLETLLFPLLFIDFYVFRHLIVFNFAIDRSPHLNIQGNYCLIMPLSPERTELNHQKFSRFCQSVPLVILFISPFCVPQSYLDCCHRHAVRFYRGYSRISRPFAPPTSVLKRHIYSCGDGSRQRSPSVDRLNDKRFAPFDSDLPPDALPQGEFFIGLHRF